ncbi:MAG TPA: alpha/beta fold hydrolase [Methylovirgula sp.]|nr:alpha/beta fold hydrolase [Methylovirgula sp.]
MKEARPRISAATMQQFSSDGVRIAFIDEGEGDPILLIHGFASNHGVNWVFPQWVKTLTGAGRRVIAMDSRGHGQSEKFYRPQDYAIALMAEDARRLLDHCGIARADVMAYSMGTRVAVVLALTHPERVRALVIGGMGDKLLSAGLGAEIAAAMEAPSADWLEDGPKMFRVFAEATRSDLKALAACARGGRLKFSAQELNGLDLPVLIAVGTKDEVAGDPARLAGMIPGARVLAIPERDHNRSVGDTVFKKAVLAFLDARP